MDFNSYLLLLIRIAGALSLFWGTLYIAYTCAGLLLKNSSIAIRWCGTIAIGMGIQSLLFNILIILGQFKLLPAILCISILTLLLRLSGNPFKLFMEKIVDDFKGIQRQIAIIQKSPFRWFFYIFFLFLLITFCRSCLLPLLGWDTATYHGVKSGIWVQQGRSISMTAPGGWDKYRNFFGGGEVFTAWAMLPFHGDLMAGTVDSLQWLLLGLALFGLGKELGVPIRFRWIAVCYVLFIPALWLSVGSGYVEPGLILSLTLGLVFGLRFLRHPQEGGPCLLLSLVGLGIGASIKITALPILAILGLLLLVRVIFMKKWKNTGWLCAGLIGALITVTPWCARNIVRTGYPLAEMNVKLAGVKLGYANETMEWYTQRPDVQGYQWKTELTALGKMFRKPTHIGPQLSMPTLIPLLMALIIIGIWIARRTWFAVFLIGLITAVLISYYHPGFTVIRLLWTTVRGRFLLPLVCPAVMLSLVGFKSNSKWTQLYLLVLLVMTMIHILTHAFWGWAALEFIPIFISLLFIGALFLIIRYVSRRFSPVKISIVASLILPFLLLPILRTARGGIRYTALSQSVVLHSYPKYWVPGAEHLDKPTDSYKIAMTSGPYQNSDNWYMAYFLGGDLQNRIDYVPISEDGNILQFGWDGKTRRKGNMEAWLTRLEEKNFTHVMSFIPASLELTWMESMPDRFRRLDGDGTSWGLYRFQKEL